MSGELGSFGRTERRETFRRNRRDRSRGEPGIPECCGSFSSACSSMYFWISAAFGEVAGGLSVTEEGPKIDHVLLRRQRPEAATSSRITSVSVGNLTGRSMWGNLARTLGSFRFIEPSSIAVAEHQLRNRFVEREEDERNRVIGKGNGDRGTLGSVRQVSSQWRLSVAPPRDGSGVRSRSSMRLASCWEIWPLPLRKNEWGRSTR